MKEESIVSISDLIMDAAISKAIYDKRDLLKPSMQHFLNGGMVNGEFDIALKKLMRWVENKKENENLKQDAAKMYSSLMDKNFQLEKENEELKQKVNDLTFDNMTYEYSEAEGNRVWPQIEEQIREDERQKIKSTIEEKDKEIERLKGLIENQIKEALKLDAVICNWSPAVLIHRQNEDWQQFKTENNL